MKDITSLLKTYIVSYGKNLKALLPTSNKIYLFIFIEYYEIITKFSIIKL